MIVFLENIQQLQSSSLDLNQFYAFNYYKAGEIEDSISRLFSRLINFKYINYDLIPTIYSSQIRSKCFLMICSFVKKIEFIENDQVIVKTFSKNANSDIFDCETIFIIDWRKAKIISKISIEDCCDLDFSWINHLNQILVYRKYKASEEDTKLLLFTKEGSFTKSIYSFKWNQYKVNSISYNKNDLEVYLNVFDKLSSIGSIRILDQDFNLIKVVAMNLSDCRFR